MVFYAHEPWGYEVEERRHAQALATAMNCVPRPRGTKAMDWQTLHRDPWDESAAQDQRFTPEQLEFLRKRKATRAAADARNRSKKGRK